MNNTSKMLLSPRHAGPFVVGGSDQHDMSSFRYMQLCIGLLHTVCSEKKKENECVCGFYSNFCSSLRQSSFYRSASMQPRYNHDQNDRLRVRCVHCDKTKAPSEKVQL